MNRIILIINRKLVVNKFGLSGNDYTVAVLSKLYLTLIGISMRSLKLIARTILTCLKITKRANCNGRTDGRTNPNFRKSLLLQSIIGHGGIGNWDVYYTSPQRLIIKFSYSLV